MDTRETNPTTVPPTESRPPRPDHNVWVGLSYEDPHAARAWLRDLGFLDGILVQEEVGGDGPPVVRHSEMLWPEGGRVMVSSRGRADGTFESAAGASTLYVVTDEPDLVWERALRLGARVVRPLEDSDYGSRGFSVQDAEGNSWSFGSYAG